MNPHGGIDVQPKVVRHYLRGQEKDVDYYRGQEPGIQTVDESHEQQLVFPRKYAIEDQPYNEERGKREIEKAHEYEREFIKKYEGQRKSQVDVPRMYDDLRLNLGAEKNDIFQEKGP